MPSSGTSSNQRDAAGNPSDAGPDVVDPMRRANISVPVGLHPSERCIATVASAGFEQWVDDLLGSVRAFGGCDDALLVVFVLGDALLLEEVVSRHGATLVRCRPRRRLDPTSKAVLYTAASVIPADRFVCLDADMLVLGDLEPLFAAIDACVPEAILICRDDDQLPHLSAALEYTYGGGTDPPFFARRSAIGHHPFVINDGVFAGSRTALSALEAELRALPGMEHWVDERPDILWRNQFAANVALARLGTAVQLDPTWNVQLNFQSIDVAGSRAWWHGREVRILHFNGVQGKRLHGGLRETIRDEVRFARFAEDGKSEQAIELGRTMAASGPLSKSATRRLAVLEAAVNADGAEIPAGFSE